MPSRVALLSILLLGIAAGCASSRGGSGPQSSGGDVGRPGACAEGTCVIAVGVDKDLQSEFARRHAQYRVYAGCGYELSPTAAPLATSDAPQIAMPAFPEHTAVVALWFGASIDQVVTVDFSSAHQATVDFGYRWDGYGAQLDPVAKRKNLERSQRLCPRATR